MNLGLPSVLFFLLSILGTVSLILGHSDHHDNEPWLTIKLEHKEALAQHVIEQAGLEVY